jgi:hypothetical protein
MGMEFSLPSPCDASGLASPAEVDVTLVDWLRQAYDAAGH